MPIKKTKIRTETSRILAETIIGPKKQPAPTQTSHDDVVDGGAPSKSPAQD
jgi:hypothetical protein